MYERWNEIYQIMETWFTFFSALFTGFSLYLVYKGYGLAKDYKKQHEEKLKSEYSAITSEKIIFNIYQIDRLGESIFQGIHFLTINKFLASEPYSDIPEEFQQTYGRLTLLNKNFEDKIADLNSLISEILVLTDFLKDNQATLLAQSFKNSFYSIKFKVWQNLLTVDSESNHMLEKIDKQARLSHIYNKKMEFRGFCPMSLHDINFEEVKNYREFFDKFRLYLLKKHRP